MTAPSSVETRACAANLSEVVLGRGPDHVYSACPPALREALGAWVRERVTSRIQGDRRPAAEAALSEASPASSGRAWIDDAEQRARRFAYQASPATHAFDPEGHGAGDADHPSLAHRFPLPVEPRERILAEQRRLAYSAFMEEWTAVAALVQQARAGGFASIADMHAAASARRLGLPASVYTEITNATSDPAEIATRIAERKQAEVDKLRRRRAALQAELDVLVDEQLLASRDGDRARARAKGEEIVRVRAAIDAVDADLGEWGEDTGPGPGMFRGSRVS